MLYRVGVAVGDVIEQGGDLLGDAVNVASRLQALASPGGICLSRAAHEAARGAVSCTVSDIGPQQLKNMPRPVPACLVPPAAIGAAMPAAGRRLGPPVVAAVLGIVLVAASAAVLPTRWTGRSAGLPARAVVLGPTAEMPARQVVEPHQRLMLAAVPWLPDAALDRLAAVLAQDPGSAVAIARNGLAGTAPSRDSAERAGEAALRACFEAGGVACRLYAFGGEVVWPEAPPPLPARPWVDPAVAPVPFDPDRIAGMGEAQRRRLAGEYGPAKGAKALALGPHGIWSYRDEKASDTEAERLALESCGERAGSACRIVAVGDSFVVPLREP